MSWIFTGGHRDAASIPAIARDFWAGTDWAHLFPRPIERAVAMRLPLTIVKVPEVNVAAVRRWLRDRDRNTPLPDDPRDLMGCLVSHHGQGIAFVCGADPSDEQRLTIAHETAHFIADYLRPRQRVIACLGEEITAVLDGERPATVFERAAAILAHVRLGPHVHLLPRPGETVETTPMIEAAESRADALALELVAPRARIIELLEHLDKSAPPLDPLSRYSGGGLGRGFARPSDQPKGNTNCSEPPPQPSPGAPGEGESPRADPALTAAEALAHFFGLPAATFAPLLRAASRPRHSPLLMAARAAIRPPSESEPLP